MFTKTSISSQLNNSVCCVCVCVFLDSGEEGRGGERLPEGQHRTQTWLLPCQPSAGDLRRTSRRVVQPSASSYFTVSPCCRLGLWSNSEAATRNEPYT